MLGESSAPLESGVATERATPQLWIGVGALAIAAALLSPYRNFLSDDGYIYLRFVRNFTEYGTFSYNGSTPTYGMTSPAWVVLVSLVHRLVGDPWIASKVVSWALTAACLWLFYLLAFRFVRSSLWAGLATVALALDPWFAKWTLSGLENPLTLTAMFGGLLLYQRASQYRPAADRGLPALWTVRAVPARDGAAVPGGRRRCPPLRASAQGAQARGWRRP